MKLRTQELRIGNLILYASDSLSMEVLEVDPVGVMGIIGQDYIWIEIKQFEGIPLTEEWLIKFGFTKTVELSYASGSEVEFNVFKKGDLTYNSLQKAWWLRGIMNHYPEYVHQLQNLVYALTGTELTITP